jgi:hypothetical protein
MKVYKQMKMYNDDDEFLYCIKQKIKLIFFASEPFFKIIYLLAFIGTLRMFYEIIFVTEEQHSGIAIYLVALWFIFLRIALKRNAIKEVRKILI